MPYHVLAASILPGTELVLTAPAQLVHHFADATATRVLDAPRELGGLQFYAVWHRVSITTRPTVGYAGS